MIAVISKPNTTTSAAETRVPPKKIPYTVLSVEGGKFKITGKDNCGKKIVAIVPKEYVVFVKNA